MSTPLHQPNRFVHAHTHTHSVVDPIAAASWTIGALLAEWAPDVFVKGSQGVDTLDTKEEGVSVAVRIQGLSIPMSSTLLPLWEKLSHPDHFLYILVATTKQ